ncbi:phosphogluconate dehydrogenase C-terminal domain-containing protein [Nocardiopsis halotolerans]|uniref:phosphogluconate dehydrogenase C-terminal domain-containing protein n=1 Tax=Nocardiopsis halotolerans TaxID=124252 RepID=UPI000349663D|nr:phosphogluconate dehydrogenase C-terminal domain-containing protein [Nocardiopsis halotolerans]
MSVNDLTIAVIGAGGKMGQRVSNNLRRTEATVRYAENSPAGQERVRDLGLTVTPTEDAVRDADVVILAVPDVVLGAVSEEIVPQLRAGAIVLTLDPAAAYAGLLLQREDVEYVCAHPAHPSIFLERTTKEEYADTFGGIAAPQHSVAAVDSGNEAVKETAEKVIRTMYAPVIDVHWVSVKQLAVLEPTLVETIACMVGELLKEALEETVNTVGVPRPAAEALFHGHIQVALANALRGDNPFSDACHIAMGHGRQLIVRDDWKRVFDDAVLDDTITKMLKIDAIRR